MSNKLFYIVTMALVFFKISGPLEATNLIFNSSFETCTNPGIPDGYGRNYFGAVREKEPTFTLADWGVTATAAYHGKVSLQTSSGLWFMACDSIGVENKPYTLSAFVKTEKPDSKVMFGQWRGGWVRDSFVVGTNWQRIVVTIPATNETKVMFAGLNLSGGKVWWDALQFEEGAAPTDYSPVSVSPADEREAVWLERETVRLKGKGTNVPVYKIGRAVVPPKLDGILDDGCWSNQTLISFPSPKDGEKARTEAMISHDDANVYFAVICHEPEMAKILAKYTNHDDAVYADDSVELFIDTQNYHLLNYGQRVEYQHFMINSLGTKAEERKTFFWGMKWDYNGRWEGVARKESDRWIVEIAVPYSSLWTMGNYPETWGINICRSRSHINEFIPWYGRYHAPETFPQVQGICPRLVRLQVNAPWSFGLGEKPGKLVINYSLTNLGDQPVKTRSRITIYSGDSREGKVYQGEEKELTRSKPVIYAFPVEYSSKEKTLRFQVEVCDQEGKRLFLSPEELLTVADLIDGPGPEYELYLVGEKQMNCWFDFGKVVNAVTNLEMECVLRDLFQKEYWKSRTPVKGVEMKLEIPLEKVPYGDDRLEARLMLGNEMVAERVIPFRRLPPPEKGTVVRTDRWRRVLLVDNRPFIGLGTSAQGNTPPSDLFFKDLKKEGINTLFLWEGGTGFDIFYYTPLRQPEVVLDNLGLWLDAADAYGMKVYVDLLDFLQHQPRKEAYSAYPELLNDVVAMVKKYSSHPALLSWNMMDEPNAQYNVQEVEAVYRLLRELDPYHPVTLNVSGEGAVFLRRWNTVMDILSKDNYPIPERPACIVAREVAEMEAMLAGRPLRYWVQSYGGEGGKWREPTPGELKSMTYMTAVYGGSQFLYFTYKPMSPDLYAMWGECAREIDQISNALAAPVRRHLSVLPEENTVYTSWRGFNDEAVIIAVNGGEDAQTVEIKLPETCRANTAQVLFEDRTIKIEGGLLRDRFQGLERHVYRLIKP